MPEYELSPAAERDLLEIASYTERTWGAQQADRYRAALKNHFRALVDGRGHSRQFLERRPELRVSRCEHHFVFFARAPDGVVTILAVLHEKMDLMVRLKDRLHIDTPE